MPETYDDEGEELTGVQVGNVVRPPLIANSML